MNQKQSMVERIKSYFEQKKESSKAPEGMCVNCWGYESYDNEYYEIIKDKHLRPDAEKYENFINKIVDKYVDSTHKHGTRYICKSCDEVTEIEIKQPR